MLNFNIPVFVVVLVLGAAATPIDPRTTTTYSSSTTTSSTSNSNSADGKVNGTSTGTNVSGNPSTARQTLWETGSCGLSTYFADNIDSNVPLVAFPESVMKLHGESHDNKLCGKIATLKASDKTMKVVVAGTTVNPDHSIDLTSDVWTFFGQEDKAGLSKNFQIEWSIDL